MVVLENWISSYGVPNTMMTDNGQQLVSNIFAALCAYMDRKLATTTEYYLQENDQVEQFNKMLVAQLQHEVMSIKMTEIAMCSHSPMDIIHKYVVLQKHPFLA